jgi:hypothetical protein
MTPRRLDYPIELMTLQNMRENGVRSLARGPVSSVPTRGVIVTGTIKVAN